MRVFAVAIPDDDFQSYCDGTMEDEMRDSLRQFVRGYKTMGIDIHLIPLCLTSWSCFEEIARM
jgi:hypothetical protein